MGSLKIVVAGCVAAQEGETLLRRVPELDLVLGPHHANRSACDYSCTCHSKASCMPCGCLGMPTADADARAEAYPGAPPCR